MTVAALLVSILAVIVSGGSVWYARQQTGAARDAVEHARISAEAATRSADLAEVVESGRRFGWRIEPRVSDNVYVLRNVGTINARNVTVAGNYTLIGFTTERPPVDIAAGQARFFSALITAGDQGGEVHITWTPDLPGAGEMTWTESPPVPHFRPPFHLGDWMNVRRAIEKWASH